MIGSSADWKLTTTAYAHQRAAIEKLSQLKVGALFMDMGTGKLVRPLSSSGFAGSVL